MDLFKSDIQQVKKLMEEVKLKLGKGAYGGTTY